MYTVVKENEIDSMVNEKKGERDGEGMHQTNTFVFTALLHINHRGDPVDVDPDRDIGRKERTCWLAGP